MSTIEQDMAAGKYLLQQEGGSYHTLSSHNICTRRPPKTMGNLEDIYYQVDEATSLNEFIVLVWEALSLGKDSGLRSRWEEAEALEVVLAGQAMALDLMAGEDATSADQEKAWELYHLARRVAALQSLIEQSEEGERRSRLLASLAALGSADELKKVPSPGEAKATLEAVGRVRGMTEARRRARADLASLEEDLELVRQEAAPTWAEASAWFEEAVTVGHALLSDALPAPPADPSELKEAAEKGCLLSRDLLLLLVLAQESEPTYCYFSSAETMPPLHWYRLVRWAEGVSGHILAFPKSLGHIDTLKSHWLRYTGVLNKTSALAAIKKAALGWQERAEAE